MLAVATVPATLVADNVPFNVVPALPIVAAFTVLAITVAELVTAPVFTLPVYNAPAMPAPPATYSAPAVDEVVPVAAVVLLNQAAPPLNVPS